jgi:hypothetical protein
MGALSGYTVLVVEDEPLRSALKRHSSLLVPVSSERLRERKVPFVLHSGYAHVSDAFGDAVVIAKPAAPERLIAERNHRPD